MVSNFSLPVDFWKNIQITQQDVEALHTHLFEIETPLTAHDLTAVFVSNRIKAEHEARAKQLQAGGRIYFPKEKYAEGDTLVFPALDWIHGKVISVRQGVNPDIGSFDVITVRMADGAQRMFAAGLAEHALNEENPVAAEDEDLSPDAVLRDFGAAIEKKLEAAFEQDEALVKVAGRWFPRGLLVEVNEGNLNLAEAVLDMAQGEPQPTSALLKDVEMPAGVNPKLAEFSMNYALQNDGRFDEVGPAGQVLWCLRRLEPEGVREVPIFLRYSKIDYDPSVLLDSMKKLEVQLDDELSESDGGEYKDVKEVTISLIYPHLRAGTLPLSARTRTLFPTAYESPRVRFTLVDAKSGLKIPGWVVREHRYVFGLREWYKSHQLMPGSLITVRRGQRPGEVIIEARTQKSAKDWIRTLIVGADGGLVFAMLKQPITAEFNDRMAIYVSDFKVLDPLWEKRRTFDELVISMMRELTKLNPQGHVHAQELYAALNLVRRVPPGPLFAALASQPRFVHVGDLHFRLESENELA
jgi:hypothetical protein